MFGKIFPRTFMLMHIGINNQTFRRERAAGSSNPGSTSTMPGLEFEASKKGTSTRGRANLLERHLSNDECEHDHLHEPRLADLPWPTIEVTDQFARQLGVYAKGKGGIVRLSGGRRSADRSALRPDGTGNPADQRRRNLQPHRQHLGSRATSSFSSWTSSPMCFRTRWAPTSVPRRSSTGALVAMRSRLASGTTRTRTP